MKKDSEGKELGRAPHGARGLKLEWGWLAVGWLGRAPHGARGLKLGAAGTVTPSTASRPARGAWIET